MSSVRYVFAQLTKSKPAANNLYEHFYDMRVPCTLVPKDYEELSTKSPTAQASHISKYEPLLPMLNADEVDRDAVDAMDEMLQSATVSSKKLNDDQKFLYAVRQLSNVINMFGRVLSNRKHDLTNDILNQLMKTLDKQLNEFSGQMDQLFKHSSPAALEIKAELVQVLEGYDKNWRPNFEFRLMTFAPEMTESVQKYFPKLEFKLRQLLDTVRKQCELTEGSSQIRDNAVSLKF